MVDGDLSARTQQRFHNPTNPNTEDDFTLWDFLLHCSSANTLRPNDRKSPILEFFLWVQIHLRAMRHNMSDMKSCVLCSRLTPVHFPCADRGQQRSTNLLVMHYGGAISSHGLLLDDADELKGAAERSVWVRPFRALKMSDFQNIVVLSHTGEIWLLVQVTE